MPAGFGVLALWVLASFVLNKPPRDWFWRLVAALQVVLGVQLVIGGVLFLLGYRPPTKGAVWLHYTYGGLFPIAVMMVAHRYARRYEGISWIIFGVAALVNFGLTFRALQTGLGID